MSPVLAALLAFSIPFTTAYPSAAAAPAPLSLPAVPGPNLADPRFKQFTPASSTDLRSPCPGLNALANHGFIHRDGRNMTIPHLIEGLAAGLNMGVDFTLAIGGGGLLSSPHPDRGSFDLSDLDQHNFPIEHDSSLSRRDAFFGNDYDFYPPNWQQVLDSFGPVPATSIASASKAKYVRVQDSMAKNPTFTYGPREFLFSYGEVAIYLQTMGSSTTSGIAPLKYVRPLFEEDRLPFAEGWRPSVLPITLPSLGAMIVRLYQANGESLPEGLRFGVVGALQDVWAGRNPITGLLANLTIPH